MAPVAAHLLIYGPRRASILLASYPPDPVRLTSERQNFDANRPKNLYLSRKLIPPCPRLYQQDHSRGRGLTTTGQPTVSPLPQIYTPCVFLHFQRLPNYRLAGTWWILVGY